MNFGRGAGPPCSAPPPPTPTCALASASLRSTSRHGTPLGPPHCSPPRPTKLERALFGALSALIGEEKDEDVAIERNFELLEEFPMDLMSLKRAPLICFSGRTDTSFKFVEQVLPEYQDQNYIYGMRAFPLMELGRINETERASRKGLAINKNDCWSQHNLCHVFQQECHFKEATEFMKSSSPSWAAYLTKDRLAAFLDAVKNENPYSVNILLAGFDSDVGASMYYIDYIATFHKIEKGAFGYGSYFCLSLMDKLYRPDMSVEELLIVDKCIKEIQLRLVVAPQNFIVKIVDKDGAREYAKRAYTGDTPSEAATVTA
ncbi:hypothetical protein GUJ93_ZPchr0013g36150 [Zizania palustris]|uniref:Proteasome subunit beta n=1 Tax=Zizania palustris TaxID=103762 RepID=A0A8J6BZ65_ZIZPA|nr:hypothetical protein GUJ93_ZPchr0013g36150 [Zizania palustris]